MFAASLSFGQASLAQPGWLPRGNGRPRVSEENDEPTDEPTDSEPKLVDVRANRIRLDVLSPLMLNRCKAVNNLEPQYAVGQQISLTAVRRACWTLTIIRCDISLAESRVSEGVSFGSECSS